MLTGDTAGRHETGMQWAEGRDAVKHSTMNKTDLHNNNNKMIQFKMSTCQCRKTLVKTMDKG